MDTIEKICEALQCQPGDVLQYVKITELKNSNGKLDEDILVETPFLDEDSSMEIQERSNYLKMIKWIKTKIYIRPKTLSPCKRAPQRCPHLPITVISSQTDM